MMGPRPAPRDPKEFEGFKCIWFPKTSFFRAHYNVRPPDYILKPGEQLYGIVHNGQVNGQPLREILVFTFRFDMPSPENMKGSPDEVPRV